jgi:hypothetical protein
MNLWSQGALFYPKSEVNADLSTLCQQKRNDMSFPLPHLLTTLTYKSQAPIDGACEYGGHEIAMRV